MSSIIKREERRGEEKNRTRERVQNDGRTCSELYKFGDEIAARFWLSEMDRCTFIPHLITVVRCGKHGDALRKKKNHYNNSIKYVKYLVI